MANIMTQVKLKNNTSRNGFDLSKRNLFSAKIGELLPVYCKEVLPGDSFKIDTLALSRTLPLNTAAFVRIKEYYDWFFVPSNLLWNKFNTFVTQMTENVQHSQNIFQNAEVGDRHPYLTTGSLFNYVRDMHNRAVDREQSALNYFGYDRGILSAKLLEYLGYGNFARFFKYDQTFSGTSQLAEDVAVNPFPILAYQKIYSDYFRDSQWEKSHAPSYNIDYMDSLQDGLQIDPTSFFSPANTWNKYNMFDLRYSNWHKDLFTGVLPNSQYGDAATVDLSSLLNPNTDGAGFALLSDISGDVTFGSVTGSPTGFENRMKVNGQSNLMKLTLNGASRVAAQLGLTSESLQSAFSVLALRQAEALQRWKEITQSQQQDYKNQIEAHFGVSVSDAYSERCKWLGGESNVIDINEVVNQNLVNDGVRNIADIAGKGVGQHGSNTNFESKVHGWLMCIYHAVPMIDYSLDTRIARQNLKSYVTDYAIPELDRTGMVSVPMIEMSNDIEINDGQLLGYAPRYYDYKVEVDEVRGAFRNRDSAWVAPFDDTYLKSLLYGGINGQTIQPLDYTFFKVNPSILDNIFNTQILRPVLDDDMNVLYETADVTSDTDQLLINCKFDVKAVRNLDRNGLPY